jgi:hypothetical protein
VSLFRKQTPSSAGAVVDPGPPPAPAPAPEPLPAPPPAPVIAGAAIDFQQVYDFGQVTAEERDRVGRAEALLAALPTKAPHKKAIVDATLKAFGVVDADKIVEAAAKQQGALQAFVRASQEQAQRVVDQVAQRIAELEAEIERCQQLRQQATTEQEDRARQVNAQMLKVQKVLEFFGHEADGIRIEDAPDPDEPTQVGAKRRRAD